MPYEIARFGWVRDLPDQRDHLYAAPPQYLSALPSQVDLRPQCPPIYDQGQIGSCTANAIGAAHEFNQMKQKLVAPSPFVPSRLFIYYNERAIEHSIGSDSGAQIRDGMKSIAKQGVCREDPTWPYDAEPFPPNKLLTKKPSAAAYQEAMKYQAIQYQRVPQVLSQMKGCLAEGYPVCLWLHGVRELREPASRQARCCADAVRPDESGARRPRGAGGWLRRCQSGSSCAIRGASGWGKGPLHMPYLYLNDSSLAADFWTLRLSRGNSALVGGDADAKHELTRGRRVRLPAATIGQLDHSRRRAGWSRSSGRAHRRRHDVTYRRRTSRCTGGKPARLSRPRASGSRLSAVRPGSR